VVLSVDDDKATTTYLNQQVTAGEDPQGCHQPNSYDYSIQQLLALSGDLAMQAHRLSTCIGYGMSPAGKVRCMNPALACLSMHACMPF